MVSTRQMSSNGADYSSASGTSEGSGSLTRFTRSSLIPTLETEAQSNITFLDLPPEIIVKIFDYLNFKNISQLRLVCKSFDSHASQLLNSTFQKLQTQMLNRFQEIKSKMPRRESARRNHHLACESDIIETLHMRLTLLQMTFGKHIERKHCCFFPGEILDEVFNILHYIRITPKLNKPYKVTDELFDLSTMAMEYFKEKIEPDLPEIAYFSDFLDFTSRNFKASGSSKYLELDSSPLGPEECKEADTATANDLDNEPPLIPPASMVLRKRIRKIKQGMKRYNSLLSILRQDLRTCKRKSAEQQRQISEQQKQLAEQQKQIMEYTTRFDENDKKNDEISRKFSTLLQELNKCKTELQYWRSKSPATPPFCTGCGNPVAPPNEDLVVLVNQGVILEDLEQNELLELGECKPENLDDEPSVPDEHLLPKAEVTPELFHLPCLDNRPGPSGGSGKKRKMTETPPCAGPVGNKRRGAGKLRSKRVKL